MAASIGSSGPRWAEDPPPGVWHFTSPAAVTPLPLGQRRFASGRRILLPMTRVVRLIYLVAALIWATPLLAQERPLVVRQLDFRGNRAIPDEILASAISTTNSSWFARNVLFRWLGLGAKRYFDEQEFRRDVVRLGVLYKRSGYYESVIDTLVRRTPENVYVTFSIQEGAPIVLTTLSVTGLDSLPAAVAPGGASGPAAAAG